MQFGIGPEKGTNNATFIARQVQKRYLLQKKELWLAFVDFAKAFDRIPLVCSRVPSLVLRQGNFRQNFTRKFPETFGTKV